MTVCHNVTSEPHQQNCARKNFSVNYFSLCDYGGWCVCLKIQSNRKLKKRGDKKKSVVCECMKSPMRLTFERQGIASEIDNNFSHFDREKISSDRG